EIRLVLRDRVRERGVPVVTGRVVTDLAHEGRDTCLLGAVQRFDVGPIGANRDHGRAVRVVTAGLEDGSEVGARTGYENDEPRAQGQAPRSEAGSVDTGRVSGRPFRGEGLQQYRLATLRIRRSMRS